MGGFQFGAITNTVLMNFCVQVFDWTCALSMWSGMDESYVQCRFAFLSNCHTVFKVVISYHQPAASQCSSGSLSFSTLAVASFFSLLSILVGSIIVMNNAVEL